MQLDFFRSIYNSEALSHYDVTRIAAAHTRINLKKGSLVVGQGFSSNEYFLVERGLFRAFVHDYKGRDITTNFMGEGEILIDALALFQRISTQENIMALTDAVLWKISFEDFQKLYHDIDAFNEWGRGWMSNQLFTCKKRSVEMLTLSARERYERLMQQRADILLHAPLKHIASYLGVTDTSLSRIRKEVVGVPKNLS